MGSEMIDSDQDQFIPGLGEDSIDSLEPFIDAPYGAYAVDMEQRIVFWNRAAETSLGFEAEEVLGKRCFLVPGGSLDDAPVEPRCTAIRWAKQGKIAPSFTTNVYTKSASEKWLTITHVLLPLEVPENSVVIHIFYDITDQIEGKMLLERLGRYISGLTPLPQNVSQPVTTHDDDPPRQRHDLTPREVEVLSHLARGRGTKAIADELVVSEATVRTHIQRVLSKLGVGSRLEAVTVATHRGII